MQDPVMRRNASPYPDPSIQSPHHKVLTAAPNLRKSKCPTRHLVLYWGRLHACSAQPHCQQDLAAPWRCPVSASPPACFTSSALVLIFLDPGPIFLTLSWKR